MSSRKPWYALGQGTLSSPYGARLQVPFPFANFWPLGNLAKRRRNAAIGKNEGRNAKGKCRPGACRGGFDGKGGLGGLVAQIAERRTNGKVELRHGG